jgi:hypothetical protein
MFSLKMVHRNIEMQNVGQVQVVEYFFIPLANPPTSKNGDLE